jgi:hypothetical protein
VSQADPKTPQEAGLPPVALPPPGQMPAGDNRWVAPHFQQAMSILNQVSRTYWWSHDEALRDSQCNADAMWRDAVISTAVRDRQRGVVQLEHQLEPRNPTDQAEKDLADRLIDVLEDIPDFQQFRRCLLDAIWWGRAANQVVYQWDDRDPSVLRVQGWTPVHGDSLVFKFDGTPGVMINPQVTGPGVELVEGRAGRAKFFYGRDRECLIVHEFEREAAAYHQFDMAGSVHGSGYRGRVYWYWWLKHNLQRIMMDFLRKVGNGFFLVGYAAGNRSELEAVQTAMEAQGGQPVLYVPLDGSRTLDETLKHLTVTMQGADFQWTVIEGLNQLIRDAILGQSMSNKAAPAGLGGSNADHMGMTDDERVKYDAVDLETPMQFLVNVLARYTAPHVRPPRFQHLADKRDPLEYMQSVQFALSAGMAVSEDDVRSELGLPKPNDGDPVLSQVQPQQAAAMGAVPGGATLAGQPGPVGPDGQPADPNAQAQQDAAQAQQIQPAPEAGSLPTQ